MAQKPLSRELAQQAVDYLAKYGGVTAAANALDIPNGTLEGRLRTAKRRYGILPPEKADDTEAAVPRLVQPVNRPPVELPWYHVDAPKIVTPERIGKMHLVIPDCQVKPGVRTDHMDWIGNYIVEKKPDTIVCIGDFADLPSLSSYDKGKVPAEGKRYNRDVDAARAAMARLLKPIDDYNRTAAVKYEPRKVFTKGNHEERADRYANLNPEMEGTVNSDNLAFEDFGWEVYPFLEIVNVDGIEYSHYFTSGVMGRPVSSAAALLRERQCSATMGHVQNTDIAVHKKTQNIAMFCGVCYLHDEAYLGAQGNSTRRQIVVKHEVVDGRYDPMLVSLQYLSKKYS